MTSLVGTDRAQLSSETLMPTVTGERGARISREKEKIVTSLPQLLAHRPPTDKSARKAAPRRWRPHPDCGTPVVDVVVVLLLPRAPRPPVADGPTLSDLLRRLFSPVEWSVEVLFFFFFGPSPIVFQFKNLCLLTQLCVVMLIHHIPAFCLITAAPLLVRLVVLVRDWSLCITSGDPVHFILFDVVCFRLRVVLPSSATIQSNLCQVPTASGSGLTGPSSSLFGTCDARRVCIRAFRQEQRIQDTALVRFYSSSCPRFAARDSGCRTQKHPAPKLDNRCNTWTFQNEKWQGRNPSLGSHRRSHITPLL